MSEQTQHYQPEPNEGASTSTETVQNVQQQASNTPKPEQASNQTNLQRIQQRKQAVLSFPYVKKLLKLAIYSKCQVRKSKGLH